MQQIKVSPPFTLTNHDWGQLAWGLGFAVLSAVGVYTTATVIPVLQSHTGNDFGVLIVTLLSAGLPVVANAIKRFFTTTTSVTNPTELVPGTTTNVFVKMILLALTLGLCVNSSALAAPDDTAILVDGAVAAKYIVYVDGQGGVTFSPLARVVRPGPTPTPTPTPTPGPLTERAKAIMAAAQKVPTTGNPADPNRVETAKGLAELFRQMAVITPQATSAPALEAALKMGLDSFLSSRGPTAPQAWQPVRDLMGAQLTQLDFSKAPLSDYAAFFGEVASGLDASTPAGGRGINPDMLKLILQIIQIVLALLKIPVPM